MRSSSERPRQDGARPAAARAQLRFGFGLLALPLLILMGAVFVLPVADTLRMSVWQDGGLTFAHYARALSDPIYARVLLVTLKIAGLTTVVCLLIGYPFAYLMAIVPEALRLALIAIVTLSFFISMLVKNYAWMVLLQDTGVINTFLINAGIVDSPIGLMYNLFGVTIAMVHALLPFMILPIYSVLSRLDVRLQQASRSLGAGGLRTFVEITLPLSLPGVGAGLFLVFVVSLGFFITPALLGSPREMMLSNLIDNQIRVALNWPFGSALAVILFFVAGLGYAAYVRAFGADQPWDRA